MRAPRLTLASVERAHIAYWIFGAVWPLVSMRSFERVTGNKRDEWLVRTVSLLMLSVVATLAALGRSRRDEAALRLLGATSAGALGSVALVGPLVGRISPVYLMDAAVDTALTALWALAPGTRSAAHGDMERDSERQDTGGQGGDGGDGAGGGRPQRGFPSTIGEVRGETHDPEPFMPEESGSFPEPTRREDR
ncbi:MAG TPA: hypothetical protein VI814_03175 [Candidatus Limnocylindria bacterium]